MAVPKKKISKSRRGQRRSHDALNRLNIAVDKTTGEAKLSHHMSLSDGYYNGRKVVEKEKKPAKDATPANPDAL